MYAFSSPFLRFLLPPFRIVNVCHNKVPFYRVVLAVCDVLSSIVTNSAHQFFDCIFSFLFLFVELVSLVVVLVYDHIELVMLSLL